VCEKFRRYAGHVIGAEQVSVVISIVGDLEGVSDMAKHSMAES
jgi:hypothetical protein